MSSPLSNNNRPSPGPEVILHQPQVNPQQPEPAETTRPPVSGPQVDNEYAWVRHAGRTCGSWASRQFRSQARREQRKLEHQRGFMESGRRQTQPWNDSFDIWGNAYNNVRNSWIEQGIWRKAWDEAWAKKKDVGLSAPSPTPEPTKSRPGNQWGHEDGGPPPDQEFERDMFRTIYGVEDLTKRYVQGHLAGPNYLVPSPETRDSEGSRPYRQFLYQIVKEREWIKDEMNFQIHFRPYNVDLDSMAYETVKNNWIGDGIWNPEWNELPGSTWAHEDPLQEQDKVDPFLIVDGSGEQPSIVVHDPSKGPRHNPQHSVPSSHEASEDPAGTGKESPAPKGVITKGEQLAKGKSAGAASNPRRPSPWTSDTAAEHQGGESSSAQTKGAKRRRPRQGDQHDTPRSAKRQKKSDKHGRGKK